MNIKNNLKLITCGFSLVVSCIFLLSQGSVLQAQSGNNNIFVPFFSSGEFSSTADGQAEPTSTLLPTSTPIPITPTLSPTSTYIPITPTPHPDAPPEYNPEHNYGYTLESALWKDPKISVCWINPSVVNRYERQIVQGKIRSTWEHHSNVHFSGWEKCPNTNDEKRIRIMIEDGFPYTTALGSLLRYEDVGMVLNFTFQNWNANCTNSETERRLCIEVMATHEFGHALGFSHEHNRPDTPRDCKYQPSGQNGDILIGGWDANSIMNYCSTISYNGGKLSDGDIATVQLFYGSPVRKLEIEGEIDMWDHENFASNETGIHIFNGSLEFKKENQIQNYFDYGCVGKEVRGEIHLTSKLIEDYKIEVKGIFKYFEYDDCSTSDLEQQTSREWTLEPGEVISDDVLLHDGDGRTHFRFTLSNAKK